MMQECWAQNGEIQLHYLDNGGYGKGMPVVFVPGLHGSAEDFANVIEAMLPRRAIAVSLRGRGQSDVPETGYRFENHITDIAALIDAISPHQPVCLVGHSVGVPYVIGYALEHPRRVGALVLAGYPARYPDLSADWGLRTMMRYPSEMSMIAVLGLQHESAEISLWDSLIALECPLLVLRGGKSSSRLPEELADQYRRFAPDAHIVVFPESGHRLWVPDMQRFVHTIHRFIETEASHQPSKL
jgi:pimeloyl-ACP methyl ester carboxylesterase